MYVVEGLEYSLREQYIRIYLPDLKPCAPTNVSPGAKLDPKPFMYTGLARQVSIELGICIL